MSGMAITYAGGALEVNTSNGIAYHSKIAKPFANVTMTEKKQSNKEKNLTIFLSHGMA